tara:strand:+ start:285 stop:833 length:549 start_codon:yes stop_codon:yes gene_type:complete
MMRFQFHFKWYARTIGLAMGIILTGFLTLTVHANGIHPASQEVYSDEVGPYKLLITSSRVVDFVHISIYLSLKDSGLPAPDASLTISAEQTGGTGISVGPMAASPIDDNLNWFSAHLPIKEAGEWTFTLTIDSPPAKKTIMFPVFVRQSGGVNITLVAIVTSIVIAVALWTGRRWKIDQHHK